VSVLALRLASRFGSRNCASPAELCGGAGEEWRFA
jgi:hypothetical protein